jgi:hypothetical protein
MTVFLPLLLSGKNRQPRSISTYFHRRCRISRRRQPVNRSSRRDAAADVAILVGRFAFGTCLVLGFDSSTVQGMPVVSASRIALPSRPIACPGLAPESIDQLFESFYTTKPGGLGLGLSICRSIIEAHQGRLWATANTPRGAVF